MTTPRLSCRAAILGAVTMLLVGLGACTSEDITHSVDFSRTKQVPRAETGTRQSKVFRIAVGAMVSPKPTLASYQRTIEYIGKKLGRPVEMIQKRTYAEINSMLWNGEVHLAFICSGPYAKQGRSLKLRLLAAPQVSGSTSYRSYLIVGKDNPATGLSDLRGRVFAFTDPDSNTGYLVPAYWLHQMGESPERFFAKTIYTHGHDNSIMAVAKGLVDAAAVDSLVWDYHAGSKTGMASFTKVIRRSAPYGNPPVVASRHLSGMEAGRIRSILLAMHLDPEGKRILADLHIDRFIAARDDWYQSVRAMQAEIVKE